MSPHDRRTESRTELIETHLTELRELDLDTFENLVDAAGLIADAEARFRQLAGCAW
jgi:hypothetical protein